MQKIVLYSPKGEVEVNVTVGAVETISQIGKVRVKTIKEMLRDFVDPPEALEDPSIFFLILKGIAEAVQYHYMRAERIPSPRDGPNISPNQLSQAFSALKYALANKLHMTPSEIRNLPIDEAFDYVVIMKSEARYIEGLQKRVSRRPVR